MSGLVDRLVAEAPKWAGGTAAYLLATVRAQARNRNRGVRLRIDDGSARETEIVNVAVANGRFFGGGMEIAPTARIDDGLLDVVGLERLGLVAQLALAPALYGGRILGRGGVTHERARRLVAEAIDGRGPVLIDIDGEAPGALPATFEIRPGAVLLRA
jgi:diacylglycerol kinase family enzyme